MGFFKDSAKKAQEEIDKALADKLMEEELNPTLREHSGEPMNTDKKKK